MTDPHPRSPALEESLRAIDESIARTYGPTGPGADDVTAMIQRRAGTAGGDTGVGDQFRESFRQMGFSHQALDEACRRMQTGSYINLEDCALSLLAFDRHQLNGTLAVESAQVSAVSKAFEAAKASGGATSRHISESAHQETVRHLSECDDCRRKLTGSKH